MHLFGIRVFEQQDETTRQAKGKPGRQLRALAAAMLTLAAGVPSGFAQQAAPTATDKAASNLPAAPAPVLTQPLYLRPSQRDFTKPAGGVLGDPINMYRPTTIAKANFENSVRLADLVKDGKIYLSLSDAIALALENNYDIAIARYNLDIADTDILAHDARCRRCWGANAGVVTNTLGGTSSTLTTGGGPGGTTGGSGGAGSGSAGLVLTTSGAGPAPEVLDPIVAGTIQFERQHARIDAASFSGGNKHEPTTYNFTYNQGFVTGTALQFGFNNTVRTTSTIRSRSTARS